MCWESKTKPEIRVADRDIPIFKVCKYHDSHSVRAYFQQYRYDLNKLYSSDGALDIDCEYCGFPFLMEFRIFTGFHSYDVDKTSVKDSTVCYYEVVTEIRGFRECLSYYAHLDKKSGKPIVRVDGYIPKGSNYAVNERGEYVSDCIVLTEIKEIDMN